MFELVPKPRGFDTASGDCVRRPGCDVRQWDRVKEYYLYASLPLTIMRNGISLIIFAILLSSCMKDSGTPVIGLPGAIPNGYVLIDASRDGSVWWYPQTTTLDPTQYHLGSALANYLGTLGYVVLEAKRGTTITKDLFKNYDLVIRAGASSNYSADELDAYKNYIQGSHSLLVMSDNMAAGINDNLNQFLGLNLEGFYSGTVVAAPTDNSIMNGVTNISYDAGSIIKNPDLNSITPLGYYSDSTIHNATAMGIVNNPNTRIFFIGDNKALESVSQPFTKNLFTWLLH
jgi:hypothetical protein